MEKAAPGRWTVSLTPCSGSLTPAWPSMAPAPHPLARTLPSLPAGQPCRRPPRAHWSRPRRSRHASPGSGSGTVESFLYINLYWLYPVNKLRNGLFLKGLAL
jgi:hypothetical protein